MAEREYVCDYCGKWHPDKPKVVCIGAYGTTWTEFCDEKCLAKWLKHLEKEE